MMKLVLSIMAAFAAIITLAAPASAATLGIFTHDYGSGPGQVDPGGNDVLTSSGVLVSDQSTGRFSDNFDLSSIVGTITGFEFSLTYSDAGPKSWLREKWMARVQGSNSSSQSDDMFVALYDKASPFTFTVDASTDNSSIDAFAHSVASQSFGFWFADEGWQANDFLLSSTSLLVKGIPAPVPLPAAGLLLLGGLGGLVALRRRKRTVA